MKRFLLALILTSAFHSIFAQEIPRCLGSADVTCPDEWEVYNNFYYEVAIPVDTNFDSSIQPFFDRIDDVFGPMTSSSYSISFIDGQKFENYSVTYKWRLMVEKEGEYVIPSFTISNDSTGDYYYVPETKVLIENSIPVADDIFIQWKVDGSPEFSVGEAIPCQLDLYSGPNLSRISDFQIDCPEDAYLVDVFPSREIDGKRTVYNHKMYNCYTIKNYNITPLSSGAFELPDASLKLYFVSSKSNHNSGSIFDSFFDMEEHEHCISTPDVTLNVNPKCSDICDTLSIERKGIAVCVDVSSSMRIKDIGPNRLSSASRMIASLRSNTRFERLSRYMAFSKSIEQDWCRNLNHYLDTLQKPDTDGTSLYDALVYPIASLSGCKDVIVITDGTDNCSHISSNTALEILKDYQIRPHIVYLNSLLDSVAFDSENVFGENMETMILNEKLEDSQLNDLKQSLQTLGGDLYLVRNEKDLSNVVKQLLKCTTSLENVKTEPIRSNNYRDIFVLSRLKRDFYPLL